MSGGSLQGICLYEVSCIGTKIGTKIGTMEYLMIKGHIIKLGEISGALSL